MKILSGIILVVTQLAPSCELLVGKIMTHYMIREAPKKNVIITSAISNHGEKSSEAGYLRLR